MDERRIFSIEEVEAALRFVLPAEEAREAAEGMYTLVAPESIDVEVLEEFREVMDEFRDGAIRAGHTVIEGEVSFTRPGHRNFRYEDMEENCVFTDTTLNLLRLVSADAARRVQLLRDESAEEAMEQQRAVASWLAERTKSI